MPRLTPLEQLQRAEANFFVDRQLVVAVRRDAAMIFARADEKLTAFLELEAAIAARANVEETTWQTPEPWASEGPAKANLLHYLFRI